MRKQTKLVAVLSAAALLAIGASMTSFAAAKGWTQEDGTWVYLDSEGERVTEEWKKSGSNYYWLDEEGEMATEKLIDDDDNYYYVDANGVRVANQWVSVDNEEGEEINGYDVDVLWYYMGSSGKAYKGTATANKNTVINGKRYLFDEDGHMLSGWLWNGSDLYYLGDENEGWAYTGWQYLEIDEDKLPAPAGVEYEDEGWFSFQSSGKARKGDRKYVDGAYYTFDANGVMQDEWLLGTPATAESNRASENRAYYTADNGAQKMGWVYTFEDRDEGGDEKWFYLVNSKKGAAFNYNGLDSNGASVEKYINGDELDSTKDLVAAKVIKGKTYLFDSKGGMLTGVYKVLDGTTVRRDGGNGNLTPGYYYFDKNGGSGEGQMMTGKVSINYDGDTYTYYFDKSTGKAVTENIKDGSYYDEFGVRADASDGNSYEKVNVTNVTVGSSATTYSGTIIVTSSGKVKKSGTVTIDGVRYEVGGKDAAGNDVADYFVSKSYDKDDAKKTDTHNYMTPSSSTANAQ